MHRQIAGKLTGPITKWIVLVRRGADRRRPRMPRRQARRRPEQRAVVLAARERRVDQGRSRSSGEFQDADDVGTLGRLLPRRRPDRGRPHRDRGAGRRDRGRSTASQHERARHQAAAALRRTTPRADGLSEDGEVAKIEFTFNFGEDGWNEIPMPRGDRRHRRRSTASTSTSPAPAARPPTAATIFEGIDSKLLFVTLSGSSILILLLTYRSPVLWILPIFCAGRGAHHRRWA